MCEPVKLTVSNYLHFSIFSSFIYTFYTLLPFHFFLHLIPLLSTSLSLVSFALSPYLRTVFRFNPISFFTLFFLYISLNLSHSSLLQSSLVSFFPLLFSLFTLSHLCLFLLRSFCTSFSFPFFSDLALFCLFNVPYFLSSLFNFPFPFVFLFHCLFHSFINTYFLALATFSLCLLCLIFVSFCFFHFYPFQFCFFWFRSLLSL